MITTERDWFGKAKEDEGTVHFSEWGWMELMLGKTPFNSGDLECMREQLTAVSWGDA